MDLMNVNETRRQSVELSREGVALRAGTWTPSISRTEEPSYPSHRGLHSAIERATSCFRDPEDTHKKKQNVRKLVSMR